MLGGRMDKLKVIIMKYIYRSIIIFIIAVFGFLIFGALNFYNKYIFWYPDDYEREIYSVMLLNNTNDILNNTEILYGFGDDFKTYVVISDIKPHEYKKVNIPTNIQSPGSYNVYIKFHDDYNMNPISVGYFGTGTGDFEAINISGMSNEIKILPNDSRLYRKLFRWHLKNQKNTSGIISW